MQILSNNPVKKYQDLAEKKINNRGIIYFSSTAVSFAW